MVAVTLDRIRKGVCSYNQEGEVSCFCDSFPLPDSEEWSEPEYRLALERRGHVEIFGFLCEWDMTVAHFRHYWLTKPSQLRSRIRPVHAILSRLEGVDLATFSESAHGADIAEAFDALRRPDSKRDGIGITSPSKVLHILMPNLFVPWDADIRRFYGVSEEPEGEDYLQFILTCSEELISVLRATRAEACGFAGSFYSGGWKPATKILDEFHIAAAKRLRPHFSQ